MLEPRGRKPSFLIQTYVDKKSTDDISIGWFEAYGEGWYDFTRVSNENKALVIANGLERMGVKVRIIKG